MTNLKNGNVTTVTPLTTITPPDVEPIRFTGEGFYKKAVSLVVDSETALRQGDALLADIKTRRLTFEPGLDAKCKEANSLRQFILDLRKAALQFYDAAEAETKRKMGAYQFKQQEDQRRQNERKAAEAQRQAEEQRKAEIEAAKKARDKEKVAELKAAPLPVPEMKMPTRPLDPPKLGNTSFRDAGYDYKITNPDLLPRKYLMPDDDKIKGVVKALGKECDIPGIVVFPKPPIVINR